MSSSEEDVSGDDEMISSSGESEKELQIALREGLLSKNGLNVLEKQKKTTSVNKRAEMEQRLFQIQKKRDWLDTLDVKFASEFSYAGAVNEDFDREAAFMKQAQNAVSIALPRLKSLKVPIFRPDDYFAEMAKSDNHMHKIRRRLLDIQKTGEKRESKRRLRDEKKFAVKVQRASKEKKHKEKRVLMEAVKKHRKGMKAQLETILNSSAVEMDEDNGRPSRGRGKTGSNFKMNRNSRDKKFGFGGQKKRSKQNDKKSFESPFKQAGRSSSKQNSGRGRKRKSH